MCPSIDMKSLIMTCLITTFSPCTSISILYIHSIFTTGPPQPTHLPNQSFNMAKLAIFGFLALFALAHVATAFRTTITTTVMEDENPSRKMEDCQEQIRRQQQVRHCQMHLREKCRSRSMLSMTVENPAREEEEGEQYLDQCCQQLRNINERCRCEGLQQVVRQIVEEEVKQQKEQEEVRRLEHTLFREASEIPSRCNVRPRMCSFSKPVW